MKDSKIQNAIATLLDQMYPELDASCAMWLRDLLETPLGPAMSATTKLKVVETIAKIKNPESTRGHVVLKPVRALLPE